MTLRQCYNQLTFVSSPIVFWFYTTGHTHSNSIKGRALGQEIFEFKLEILIGDNLWMLKYF